MSERSIEDMAANWIGAAAFLKREFLGRRMPASADKGQISPGEEPTPKTRTICLVDTDVVTDLCAPWRSAWGPSARARLDAARRAEAARGWPVPEDAPSNVPIGTGEIFPFFEELDNAVQERGRIDPEERAIRITAILAEYVLNQVRDEAMPIFQLPAHYEETRQNYLNLQNWVQSLAKSEVTERRDSQTLRHAAALLGSYIPPEQGKSDLLPLVRYMLEKMSPLSLPRWKDKQNTSSSLQIEMEWDRFVRLNTATGGLYHASFIGNQLAALQQDAAAVAVGTALSEKLAAEDQLKFDAVKGFVIAQLVGNRRTPTEHELKDAASIGNLYLINEKLKGTGWRAIFVTASRRLSEACYADFLQVYGLDREVAKNFSQQFVRHTWAYTTEALLEPTSGRANFMNWLDGLLAKEASPDDFQEKRLSDIVRNKKDYANILLNGDNLSSRLVITSAQETWLDLTADAIARHRIETLGIGSEQAAALQQRILDKVRATRSGNSTFRGWDELLRDLQEDYDRARDRFYFNYSSIGKGFIFSGNVLKRNPPDLYFQSLGNSRRILERLCSPHNYPREDFEADFKNIADDCPDPASQPDDRMFSHLRFLLLGAAFAAADRWGVALSHGQMAVAIVERRRDIPIKTKGPETNISGREAYFLCAVATRVSAQNRRDFYQAERYLLKSETALEQDRKLNDAQRATLVRHKCERLALQLSRYYYERFELNRIATRDEEYCDEFVRPIYEAARVMLSEIAGSSRNMKPLDHGDADLTNFGKVTLASVATNIVQVCTIRAFRRHYRRNEPPFPVTESHLRQSLDLLRYFRSATENQGADQIRQTKLIRVYADIGARLLKDRSRHSWLDENGIAELLSEGNGRDVTRYDPWRFGKIGEFLPILNGWDENTTRNVLFAA